MLFRSTGDSTRQSVKEAERTYIAPAVRLLHWVTACATLTWKLRKCIWSLLTEIWMTADRIGGVDKRRTAHALAGRQRKKSLIDLFLVNCENRSELKISSFFMRFSLLFALETQLLPPPEPVPPLWGNSQWNADVQPANCQHAVNWCSASELWIRKRREGNANLTQRIL